MILRMLAIIQLLNSPSTFGALEARDLDNNFDNGHEAVYDDILDITWLADANLASTNTFGISGINSYGEMHWDTAENFIQAMNQVDAHLGYLGVNTWRQSKVNPVNGNRHDVTLTYDGSTDSSYQLSAPVSSYNPWGASAGFTGSELAYHYHNNFDGVGDCFGIGNVAPACNPHHIVGIQNAGNSENLSLFNNIRPWPYWTGTELPQNTNNSFAFDFSQGFQDAIDKETDIVTTYVGKLAVWPVSDGDVGTPMPATDVLEVVVPIPLLSSAILFVVLTVIALKRVRENH